MLFIYKSVGGALSSLRAHPSTVVMGLHTTAGWAPGWFGEGLQRLNAFHVCCYFLGSGVIGPAGRACIYMVCVYRDVLFTCHIKDKYSLAALMKLLWYWYVMSGAGSILQTGDGQVLVSTHLIKIFLYSPPLFFCSVLVFLLAAALDTRLSRSHEELNGSCWLRSEALMQQMYEMCCVSWVALWESVYTPVCMCTAWIHSGAVDWAQREHQYSFPPCTFPSLLAAYFWPPAVPEPPSTDEMLLRKSFNHQMQYSSLQEGCVMCREQTIVCNYVNMNDEKKKRSLVLGTSVQIKVNK